MKTYIVTIIDRYGKTFPLQGKAVGNTAIEALRQWDGQHGNEWHFTIPIRGRLLCSEIDRIYFSGGEMDVIVKMLDQN